MAELSSAIPIMPYTKDSYEDKLRDVLDSFKSLTEEKRKELEETFKNGTDRSRKKLRVKVCSHLFSGKTPGTSNIAENSDD